jgi:signal transduction histidine kinase
VSHQLSDISLQIHNPGFYSLAALKGNLIKNYPDAFADPGIAKPVRILQDLLDDLHEKGNVLKCRGKDIQFLKWIRLYVDQMILHNQGLNVNLDVGEDWLFNSSIKANEAQLETLFENLFANSIRAIKARQRHDIPVKGRIDIHIQEKEEQIRVKFQDNGLPYKTVSGHGMPLMRKIMHNLGGNLHKHNNPYCIYLTFPMLRGQERRNGNESKNPVFR